MFLRQSNNFNHATNKNMWVKRKNSLQINIKESSQNRDEKSGNNLFL